MEWAEWEECIKMKKFNIREAYNLVHQLLLDQKIEEVEPVEQGVDTPQDIKKDPKLLAIKKKAAELSAKAELERSKNQMAKAKLDKQRIVDAAEEMEEEKAKEAEAADHKEPVTVYPRKDKDEDLNSGDPINKKKVDEPEEESLTEGPYSPEEDDELAELAPGNEDVIEEPESDTSLNEEDEEDLSQLPADAEEDEEQPSEEEVADEEANVQIAGDEPQTREEAEIARIQARTRQIQAQTGEYTPPGAEQAQDEEGMEDDGMGDGMDDMGEDNMGDQNIDPMTGMPVEEPGPPDPMKGFGDTTDPDAQQNAMMGGMGGIDPMTGQPLPDEPSKTPTALGRLYMMKKIYYRLALLDNILTSCPDEEINELREDVKEAFEVFKLIVHNLKAYKGKADEIIVDYYMLIRDITKKLELHFKERKMMSED